MNGKNSFFAKIKIFCGKFNIQNITNGRIHIENNDITKLSPRDRDIAMIFQSYALYPHMTVYENLSIPLKLKKTPKNEIQTKIDEIASMLSINDLLKRYPRALSGGQKQRLSIARAILKNAPIILLDEATSSLDAESEEKVQNAIFNLTKNKTTLVIAHRLSTIKRADKIIVMKNGNIVGSGNHDELLKKSKFQVKRYLILMNFCYY